jgi:hypothetical protein
MNQDCLDHAIDVSLDHFPAFGEAAQPRQVRRSPRDWRLFIALSIRISRPTCCNGLHEVRQGANNGPEFLLLTACRHRFQRDPPGVNHCWLPSPVCWMLRRSKREL